MLSKHARGVTENRKIVEQGPADAIVTTPREAYTQELMRAAFGKF
jgi:ABC-type microcin C transport system duplicated ATPase subunit YejF